MNSRMVGGITSMAAVVLAVVGLAIGSTLARATNQDVVDTAVDAGQFKTLATALKAAGLVETLKRPGPFTVFAPTDEAFAKLPAGTVENLLKPENKAKLTAILTYHVVPGAVKAEQVTKLNEAKTVNGAMVKVSSDAGKVMINDATVVKADIAASNGVIHVIDKVILPPESLSAVGTSSRSTAGPLSREADRRFLDDTPHGQAIISVVGPGCRVTMLG